MISEPIAKIGLAAFFIGIINFGAFCIIAVVLGGDAVSGHESAGKYFLANHGKLTEVSHFVFLYSRVHVYSLIVTHPLAILGGWLYDRWGKQNKIISKE